MKGNGFGLEKGNLRQLWVLGRGDLKLISVYNGIPLEKERESERERERERERDAVCWGDRTGTYPKECRIQILAAL